MVKKNFERDILFSYDIESEAYNKEKEILKGHLEIT